MILNELFFRLRNKRNFIFGGHSQGGSIAAIASFLAIKYIKKKNASFDTNRIITVTLGSPLFADNIARSYWQKEIGNQYHFVLETDPVPAILARAKFDAYTSELLDGFLMQYEEQNWILKNISKIPIIGRFTRNKAGSDFLKYFNDDPDYCTMGNYGFLRKDFEEFDSQKNEDSINTLLDIMAECIEMWNQKKDQNGFVDVLRGVGVEIYHDTITQYFQRSIDEPDNGLLSDDRHDKNDSETFKPEVSQAILIKPVQMTGEYCLELRGKNLSGIVLEKCHFEFDFKIDFTKKIVVCNSRGENQLKIWFKNPAAEYFKIKLWSKTKRPIPPDSSSITYNKQMTLCTIFGQCQFIVESLDYESPRVKRRRISFK